MSLIIKKNTTFKILKDRVVVPITLGPPLPSTILLQGGWKNYYNNTIINGSYIKVSGTYAGSTIFYYNPNVILANDGYPIGYDFYPMLFFNSSSVFPPYVPCWIIVADDVVYTNSSTNNQVIPSTNWVSASSLPIGTIQAVN